MRRLVKTDACAGCKSAQPATEKAPREIWSGWRDRDTAQAVQGRCYGNPVQARRRPGGTDLAIIGQGSQAYLSLPPSCQGVSEQKARQIGSHHSLGLREDERDGAGIDESRGKLHLTWAIESPLGDELGTTDVRAWGRRTAPRGPLSQPEWHRGCEQTKDSLPRYVGDRWIT